MIGPNCKLYRNTGTWGSPTWTEITEIGDAQLNPGWESAAASIRATPAVLMEKTQLNIEITGKLQASLAGTNYLAIWASLISRTSKIDVLVLNGPSTTNGARGFRFEAQVFQGNQDQSLGASLFDEIAIRPCPPSVATQLPQSCVVSGGAPVFTDLA